MRQFKSPTLRAILRWAIVPVVSFVLVVAVAMGCAVWSPLVAQIPYVRSMNGSPWASPNEYAKYKDDCDVAWSVDGRGYSGCTLIFIYDPDNKVAFENRNEDGYAVTISRTGYPFRCLRWTIFEYRDVYKESVWVQGIEADWAKLKMTGPGSPPATPRFRSRRIPLMPEPVGMVLNVLIYSAAIVLPRFAWRRAVVVRRKRKGLCLKCAYPIEPSVTNCPECGQAYAKGREAASKCA